MGIRCPLKSSSGFLSLGIMGYAALAAGVVILGLSVALKVQSARLVAANERLDAIKLAGQIAQAAADKQAKEDKERKAKSDAQNNRAIAALRLDNDRLRKSANSSSLPAADPATGSPDRIAFDRGQLDQAIRDFTGRTAEIVAEGAEAIVNLDSAKQWAQTKP